MRFRALLLSAIAAGFIATPALAAAPNAAIMTTLNGLLAATNADNASKVNSYFTSPATIVDEFPPYTWTGPNAGAAWWRAVAASNVSLHIKNMHVAMGRITQSNVSGSWAYAVVPLTITATSKGKPWRETGLWAAVLHRTGGVWKVASASWATSTTSM
jgi:ketosteroid isomerase-like protein